MIPFIQTNNSITLVLEGIAYTIPKDYDGYTNILKLVSDNDETALSMLLHNMATKPSDDPINISLDTEWKFQLNQSTNEIKLDCGPDISL